MFTFSKEKSYINPNIISTFQIRFYKFGNKDIDEIFNPGLVLIGFWTTEI